MTIDPTTIGLGLGGGIIAIFLLRFIFGKKKLNAMATEVTKVRDSDHIPEPVEVPPADHLQQHQRVQDLREPSP